MILITVMPRIPISPISQQLPASVFYFFPPEGPMDVGSYNGRWSFLFCITMG
ncbi:hypothetical protein OIU77_021191 [Salix suchowensis]|uniref:Uncharacterized protein n=1 Tax=Salix suchowensis TaxID=1278906 RepID=A0ABQ9C9W9_9ROSI|nr:hypothetical protein OIU77_021191 [Salix suchowensis]